jgi:hypothetical protein
MQLHVNFMSPIVTSHHDKLTILSGTRLPAPGCVQYLLGATRLNFAWVWHSMTVCVCNATDDEKYEIPLHCYGLRGDIKFNPEFKCGALVSGQMNELQLPLRNEGPAEASFQFQTTEDSIIKFNPPSGTLAAKGEKGSSTMVKVEINSERVGSFREVVRVQLYADQPPKLLDCHGTVV